MPSHFLLHVFALSFVTLLSGCQDEFDSHIEPTSFFHDRKITKPTKDDDANVIITPHAVVLTKAHLSDVRTELYQPSLRLEGIIASKSTTTAHLPHDGSLYSLSVRLGDTVYPNDVIAHIIEPTNNQSNDDAPNPTGSVSVNDTDGDVSTEHGEQKTDDDNNSEPSDSPNEPKTIEPIKITAINVPIFGKIQEIFIHDTKKVYPKGTPLMVIADDKQLKFMSLLPKKYRHYLKVGKAVNFSTELGQPFVGQIAKIEPDHNPNFVQVHVHIAPDEAKRANLNIGEQVSGHINYGQMSVGAIVPNFAIFNDMADYMDLSALDEPPHKPATPIHAYLWLVGQDGIIRFTETEVIEYRPTSGQYLVAGVPPEKLISLARLPKNASGKQVKLN